MQMKSVRNSAFSMLFLLTAAAFAQDLGSETVEVIKPYTPSVNDAFKIKEIPKITDSLSLEKKPVQYSIFSVPVASTFSPAKGRAANVEREKPLKIYDNYATLGVGNYTSVLAELYSNLEVSKSDNFGIFLTHNSAQGGIDGVFIDDTYYDSELNLNYSSRKRNMDWNTDVGIEHQLYNWYGVPEFIEVPSDSPERSLQQNYYSLYAGAELNFHESFFNSAAVDYRYFGDSHSSAEHRISIKPTLEIPIADELFHTQVVFDYLSGGFDRAYLSPEALDYGFMNLGLSSSLVILRDDLTVNLGAAVFYSQDVENSDGDLFVYPQVTASYRLAGEYFTAYAGLEGELEQNSYYDFVQENPFVSPTLNIRPTDQQYETYVGARGKISNSVGYNIRGSFVSENSKPLFSVNPVGEFPNPEEYAFGNSFQVVYDDVNTISFFGELILDVNRNFNLRLNGEYFNYNTDTEAEAWNLPEFKASFLADYQIGENWFAGANLYYVGEREDRRLSFGPNPGPGETPVQSIVSLDNYFDINANLGYRFNEQLSVFLRGKNLLGDEYERWTDYPVLGLQVMAGVTYKFDY